MHNYYPLLIVGGIIGLFTAAFIIAFASIKDKKEAIGFERNMKDIDIFKRLVVVAKPYWKSFLFAFFLMILTIAFDIVSPLIVGDIQEMFIAENKFELSDLYIRVALFAIMLIVSLGSAYIQGIVLQKAGQRIISDVRIMVFTHIEKLSHEQLTAIPVGKLVTRVTNDPGAVSMMFTGILNNILKNAFVLVGALIAMFCVNIELTLMILCFTPFIVLFTIIFRKFSRMAYRKVKDGTTDLNVFLSENLSGIKVTQLFNKENFKLEEFRTKNRHLEKARTKQVFVFGIFRPIIYMLFIMSKLCLFYFAGKGFLDGTTFFGQTITAPVLVTMYMYFDTFFNPLQSLAEHFNNLQNAFASGEKIFSILDIEPSIQDSRDAEEVDNIKGDIEFKNVWFSYIPDRWVLKDISFKVEAGQTVAFVGATGSGKTTILSLITRNYDIQKGQILIDGRDIKEYKISSLRRHFGQMLQDVFIFSGTIKSNILLRKDDVSDEEIMAACRYVNADKFINKLENGLDEVVRERGNNFSAGQRQLLSFARTIIHSPSVMILDEATANIDTETEILIQDSLEKMRNIGTMLIVAHRLSTIRNADNIIVMQSGRIIEEGNHQELLEKHGHYHKLYTLQSQKQSLAASGN